MKAEAGHTLQAAFHYSTCSVCDTTDGWMNIHLQVHAGKTMNYNLMYIEYLCELYPILHF